MRIFLAQRALELTSGTEVTRTQAYLPKWWKNDFCKFRLSISPHHERFYRKVSLQLSLYNQWASCGSRTHRLEAILHDLQHVECQNNVI